MENEFILIFGMMLVTFAVRYPVLAFLSKVNLPEPIFRALNYVPPAVLTAIIAPAIIMPGGEISITLSNAHLLAGIVAIVVAILTKKLLPTIILGMAAFWLLRVM